MTIDYERTDIEEANRKGLLAIGKSLRKDLEEDGVKVTLSGTNEVIKKHLLKIFDEHYDSDDEEEIIDEPEPTPEPISTPTPKHIQPAPKSERLVSLGPTQRTQFMDFRSNWKIQPGEQKSLPKPITDGIQAALDDGRIVYI